MQLKWLTPYTIVCAVLFLFSTLVSAEEEMTTTTESISIPLAEKPTSDIERPTRGESQAFVLSNFGEPDKKHPARGKPPISKWEYSNFTVIFESGFVIHTVVKTKR